MEKRREQDARGLTHASDFFSRRCSFRLAQTRLLTSTLNFVQCIWPVFCVCVGCLPLSRWNQWIFIHDQLIKQTTGICCGMHFIEEWIERMARYCTSFPFRNLNEWPLFVRGVNRLYSFVSLTIQRFTIWNAQFGHVLLIGNCRANKCSEM